MKIRFQILLSIMFSVITFCGCINTESSNDQRTSEEVTSTSDNTCTETSMDSETTNNTNQKSSSITLKETESSTLTAETQENDQQEVLDNCRDVMNSILTEELVPIEAFDPQNKESGHYRSEFRLIGFKDAIGQSYSYGDANIDIIVQTKSVFDSKCPIRVYIATSNFDLIIELFKAAAFAMDSELSDTELQKAVDYLNEHKEANGYYFSNLGITYLSNRMMIKCRND